jgi:RNA polymerase sigma-70 factor, ECF subfamily
MTIGRRPVAIDSRLVDRLYRRAHGERWRTPIDRFAQALQTSGERAFADGAPEPGELERYLTSLHLEDLALACACAAGDEQAWEHFVAVQRPFLYRAADALDRGGGARDLADAIYADLYARSLFRYFHGRSSLATWLRSIVAQRHVDRLRAGKRSVSLPDEDSSAALSAPPAQVDPDRSRFLALTRTAMKRAAADLPARDRLRLACYYAQELTLAETGRVLGEHEATVSRALARSRESIRQAVERDLGKAGLADDEIGRCFASLIEDAGPLSVHDLIGADPAGAGARNAREIVLSKRKAP